MASNFLAASNFIVNSFINSGLLRADHYKVEVPIFGVSYNAIKVSIGEVKFESEKTNINTVPIYHIKNRARDPLTITFLDTADYAVRASFYSLMSQNGFEESKQVRGYYDDFKMGNISVIPLHPDGSESAMKDVFEDVFVETIGGLEFDYGTPDLLYTTITFNYKYHHITKN